MRKLLKLLTVVLLLILAGGIAAFILLPSPVCPSPVYTEPSGLAIAPDGQFAYVSDSTAPRLVIVSLADNRVAATLPLPAPVQALALSRDGAKLFLVLAQAEGAIAVVDTASRKIERTIAVGGALSDVAVSADGRRVFTMQTSADKLLALDAVSGKLLANVGLYCPTCELRSTSDGKYLIAGQSRGLTVFDAQSLAVSTEYETPDGLSQFMLSPDGKTLAYAALSGGAGVRFISLADKSVEPRATLAQIAELAFSADGTMIIAADAGKRGDLHGGLSIMPVHIPQEVKGAIVPSVPPDRSTALALDAFPSQIAVDGKRNRIAVVAIPAQGEPKLEILDGKTYKMLAQIAMPDAKTSWDRFLAWRLRVLHGESARCASLH